MGSPSPATAATTSQTARTLLQQQLYPRDSLASAAITALRRAHQQQQHSRQHGTTATSSSPLAMLQDPPLFLVHDISDSINASDSESSFDEDQPNLRRRQKLVDIIDEALAIVLDDEVDFEQDDDDDDASS